MHQVPVLFDLTLISSGSGAQDLDLERVPAGWRWHLDHVAVEDVTNNATSVRIGIKRGTTFLALEEQKSAVGGTLYSVDRPFSLEEGNILTARFTGSTSGDTLRLYANGEATPRG